MSEKEFEQFEEMDLYASLGMLDLLGKALWDLPPWLGIVGPQTEARISTYEEIVQDLNVIEVRHGKGAALNLLDDRIHEHLKSYSPEDIQAMLANAEKYRTFMGSEWLWGSSAPLQFP